MAKMTQMVKIAKIGKKVINESIRHIRQRLAFWQIFHKKHKLHKCVKSDVKRVKIWKNGHYGNFTKYSAICATNAIKHSPSTSALREFWLHDDYIQCFTPWRLYPVFYSMTTITNVLLHDDFIQRFTPWRLYSTFYSMTTLFNV